jgi:hypothetical protein
MKKHTTLSANHFEDWLIINQYSCLYKFKNHSLLGLTED